MINRFSVPPLFDCTKKLANVASGKNIPDLILANARILSTYTDRILEDKEIWISKGRIAVRTKTLEDPIEPQAHIFVKDKDPCIEIKDKTICHDTMYDREKTWPKESLDRIK